MTGSWRQLPAIPRAIAAATVDAVDAARRADPLPFRQATQRLGALDGERVGLVLGAVVRALLEDRYPAGLSSEDAQDVITRCAGSARSWFPAVDADVLIVLVTGALGLHPAPEERPISALEMSSHAPLLVDALLAGSGRRLDAYLDAAFAEIARAETVEMP
jgi:hypothetical protein